MSKQTIATPGVFTAQAVSDINANFTELYTGVPSEALASPTVTGTVAGAATYTTPTLTTPVVATGLSASGSAANDFSASTGTFKTSSGANQLTGATTIADAATPSLTTAASSTNTGFVKINGKTSGSMKLTTADATAQDLTVAAAAQTTGAATLTIPDLAGVSDSVAVLAKAQTLVAKTLTSPTLNTPTINTPIVSDYKVLAAQADYSATITPATLTGFSWTVVAGVYLFELNLPAVMTTVGGLTINFALTTAVLTSIQYQSYAATAADATTAVSTQGTTTTSGTKVFDSKTAAYTLVTIKGSMVVGTGGTFAWQGTQNTSAGAGDASAVKLGAFAKLTRVS